MTDAVFGALSEESRRLTLYYLRDRTSAGLDELATVVSGWLRARAPGIGVVTPEDRESVRAELHRVHLRKLADAGFVRYDLDSGDVTFTGTPELLDTVLDRSLSDERRRASGRSSGSQSGNGRAGESEDGRSPGRRQSERTPDRRQSERTPDRRQSERTPDLRTSGQSPDEVDGRHAEDSRRSDERESDDTPSLRAFIDETIQHRRRITVFGPENAGSFADYFEARGVTVERESLPDDGSGGVVVVTANGEFLGSVPNRASREFVSPDVRDPEFGPNETVRLLMVLLSDTTFVSLDRRQLLAASREIEERAYRVGRGTLRAGFQSLSLVESQRATYETLVGETDLDVHLYGEPNWELSFPGATVHAENAPEIGRFWFVIFTAEDERQSCALLAEELPDAPGSYRGFWTYDSERVAALDAYLDLTY